MLPWKIAELPQFAADPGRPKKVFDAFLLEHLGDDLAAADKLDVGSCSDLRFNISHDFPLVLSRIPRCSGRRSPYWIQVGQV